MLRVAVIASGLVTLLAVTSPTAHAQAYEMGVKVYNQGNYGLAIDYFKQAALENSSDPNIQYYLATALVRTNRLGEAQTAYQRVIAMAPDSEAARLSHLGLVKLRGGLGADRGLSWQMASASGRSAQSDKLSGLTINGEDYLNEITESGRFVRWSVLGTPLKLYVEDRPQGIRNFEQSYVASARRALDVWMRALENKMSYQVVNNPEDADIRVDWVNTIDTQGRTSEDGTSYTAGVTIPIIDKKQLKSMKVRLATFNINGEPQNAQNIYAIAVHEMGHAMGLLGHSEMEADIMHARNKMITDPSKRDLNTVRKLYSIEVDVTSAPPDEDNDDSASLERVAQKLDESIAKEEALAERDPSNLNWLNLGITYSRKAENLRQQAAKKSEPEAGKLKADAMGWYQKAVDTIGKSIAMEPKNAMAYYNRAVIYEEMESIPPALADIESAIRYDGREAKYYREKAWILGKLGRKVEAKNALEAYLIRDPEGAQSQAVMRIRKLLAQG